jgi:hypothetical protein
MIIITWLSLPIFVWTREKNSEVCRRGEHNTLMYSCEDGQTHETSFCGVSIGSEIINLKDLLQIKVCEVKYANSFQNFLL